MLQEGQGKFLLIVRVGHARVLSANFFLNPEDPLVYCQSFFHCACVLEHIRNAHRAQSSAWMLTELSLLYLSSLPVHLNGCRKLPLPIQH